VVVRKFLSSLAPKHTGIFSIISIFIIAVAIPVTVLMSQQRQNTQNFAATTCTVSGWTSGCCPGESQCIGNTVYGCHLRNGVGNWDNNIGLPGTACVSPAICKAVSTGHVSCVGTTSGSGGITTTPTAAPTAANGSCPTGQKKGFAVCSNFIGTYDKTGTCGVDSGGNVRVICDINGCRNDSSFPSVDIGLYCSTSIGTCTRGSDGLDHNDIGNTLTCEGQIAHFNNWLQNPYPLYNISPAYLFGTQALTNDGLLYARYLNIKMGPNPANASGENPGYRGCDRTVNNSVSYLAWVQYIKDQLAGIAPAFVQDNGYTWNTGDMQRNLDNFNKNIAQNIAVYNAEKIAQQAAIKAGNWWTYFGVAQPSNPVYVKSLSYCSEYKPQTPSNNAPTVTLAAGSAVAPSSSPTSIPTGASSGSVSNANNTYLAGDINRDHKIDIIDYNIFWSCFNKGVLCSSKPSYRTLSDLNHDGRINIADYNLFLIAYSKQNTKQ